LPGKSDAILSVEPTNFQLTRLDIEVSILTSIPERQRPARRRRKKGNVDIAGHQTCHQSRPARIKMVCASMPCLVKIPCSWAIQRLSVLLLKDVVDLDSTGVVAPNARAGE
jgi:hypothetical protein